jgi:2-C-methyl-D-erythritol 2,4-cyclodiphosphate synthase
MLFWELWLWEILAHYYPDNDLSYKDIDSRILLRRTYPLITEKGWLLNNLDAVICWSATKTSTLYSRNACQPGRGLNCEIGQISIKATTEEGLGISGKGEGISAFCQLLLVTDKI